MPGGSQAPATDGGHDARITDKAAVKRVVFLAGKLYYDLIAELDKNPNPEIAIVRLEQYYPLPDVELKTIADSYPNAELVFAQEEPENQGAWPYFIIETNKLGPRPVNVVARPYAASSATGSAKRHAVEQAELVRKALTM